ncbi:MAG: TonB-dependent receptor plug domain-containing protein [Gammaproteobacteria bacterium]
MKRPVALGIRSYVAMMVAGAGSSLPQFALAADDAGEIETVQVTADRLHVLPTEPVDSVFGFGKTALETPRAVTSISHEMLDKVIITEIDDLVALTPGSFTQSFFGVAGSLDVRGTPGENYFRGVKRIDNPGNYPTPIGASDRIDVVRGPASPIYGPSKIGGYLNFVPKSARASTGQFFDEPKAEMGITVGSWDKKILTAEVGGPASLFGKSMGYYLYAETEDSGSYYQNTETQNSVYQASFDLNISDTLRTEFGGMYQKYKGNQVAGWNRLTQDLVDHGTYITGSPVSLDTNGDGLLSPSEATAGNISAFIFAPSTLTPAQIIADLQPNMKLLNAGTTHIKGSDVLVQEDDTLEDDVVTLYGDLIWELTNGLKVTNKMFFESLDNTNENAYGFSQMANTWVVEDQLIFSLETGSKDGPFAAGFQVSPSIRHQDYEHGDDFTYEYFDRRDITKIGTPIDRRTMATRGQQLYTDHTKGHFTDSGFSAMADLTFFGKLDTLLGARYDYLDMTSTGQPDAETNPGVTADDTKGATSWSASVSYDAPFGLRPYVTIARQSTLILGQGGQIDVGQLLDGTAVGKSKLDEYGLKASLLDNQLYAALDYFKQDRTDYNSQDIVTNAGTESKGWEFEARWVVSPIVTFTGAYTNLKVINLTAQAAGSQFSFAGAGDLKGVDPALFLGGVVPSIVLVDSSEEANQKAGIPENMVSVYALLSLPGELKGFTASIGATHVDSVWSGFSKTVKLPSYTLLNAGVHFENKSWSVGVQGKNLTNERYFRSNFPDLFGTSVVLPELPRNFLVSASYKF